MDDRLKRILEKQKEHEQRMLSREHQETQIVQPIMHRNASTDASAAIWQRKDGTWVEARSNVATSEYNVIRPVATREKTVYVTPTSNSAIALETYMALALDEAMDRVPDFVVACACLERLMSTHYRGSTRVVQDALWNDVEQLPRSLEQSHKAAAGCHQLNGVYMSARERSRRNIAVLRTLETSLKAISARAQDDEQARLWKLKENNLNAQRIQHLQELIASHKQSTGVGLDYDGPIYETTPFDQLPDELIVLILLQLTHAGDIVAVSSTCRRLRRIAGDGAIWKQLFQHTFPKRQRLQVQRMLFIQYNKRNVAQTPKERYISAIIATNRTGMARCTDCQGLFWMNDGQDCQVADHHNAGKRITPENLINYLISVT